MRQGKGPSRTFTFGISIIFTEEQQSASVTGLTGLGARDAFASDKSELILDRPAVEADCKKL